MSLPIAHNGKEGWSPLEVTCSVVFGHAGPYTVFEFDRVEGLSPEPAPDH